MKIVTLEYDESPENPSEWDGWKLYSFSGRHNSHQDRENFFPGGKPTLGLRRKLEVGTAFLLDYYEHGQCAWSLHGEGPQCQWDTAQFAGLLVWEAKPSELGAKTKEDREKSAEDFCETYSNWCNGYVYGFVVEDVKKAACGHNEEPEEIESCYGLYDVEGMAQEVRAAVAGDPDVQIRGKASDLADYHDFGQEKKKSKAPGAQPVQEA